MIESHNTVVNHKFLRACIYYASELLYKALRGKKNAKPFEKITLGTERDIIQSILCESSNNLAKKAVVLDIKASEKIFEGKQKWDIQINCKYGLKTTMDNINNFIDFCAIHGFIPLIDKIEIEGNNISETKNIYNLLTFTLFNDDCVVENILNSEFKKHEESGHMPVSIFDCIKKITMYIASIYPHIYGASGQKENITGSLSENIFVEIALAMQDEITEKTGINSSYIKPASYKKDRRDKTDMIWILNKNKDGPFRTIPIQFTIASDKSEINKEEKVEKHLITKIANEEEFSGEDPGRDEEDNGIIYSFNNNKNSEIPRNFIILSVNGEFKTKTQDTEGGKNITSDYMEWKENPHKREEITGTPFPLYINSLDFKTIQPAMVIDTALHLLYKKYDFKFKNDKDNFKRFIQYGTINSGDENNGIIKGIKIDQIYIKGGTVSYLENWNKKRPGVIKHKFPIYYEGEFMGTIVIYALKQNHNQRKKNI